MLEPNAAAPDFTLDGFRLGEELLGGELLLVFFKISCPTCQFTLPFFERIHQRGTLRVFGISQDDSEGTREFRDEFGIGFPTLTDPGDLNYPVSNAFGLTNVPSSFLVSRDARILWALNGFHKAELARLAQMYGESIFLPGERLPAMRPG